MSLHWKMHTSFPFTRVFVLGIILFFLGLASMIIAIIAFVTQSWGHYVGTGMWGGATIVASGLTAVFVSRLKSLASVKTFCICSVTAMFTSLTMLILSAGGLTLSSGFYNRIDPVEYNKRTSNLIHASLLVISVFCLSGNVLAVIVCSKYLFFEHHEKPKHRRHHHRSLPEGSIRTSCTLRGGAPNVSSLRTVSNRTHLQGGEQNSRRHSDNGDVNRVQIEYRRSHRRTASDQPHSNSHHSHSRRQRHSHQEFNHGFNNNNSNLLSPCGVRYHPDRRSGSNRSTSQGREVRGDSKEREILNIVPQRQGSSRSSGQVHLPARTSRSPTSASPKVRLPTEFNEEELPPYEAVEVAANAFTGSASDSGDESDTENSSSTDAHSYDAVTFEEDGAETVPMVELWPDHRSRGQSSRQLSSTNFTPSQETHIGSSTYRSHIAEHSLEQQTQSVILDDRQLLTRNETSGHMGPGAMIMRKDSSHFNGAVLSYVNTQSSDHLGEYERLLSVSPEVCAITGESPEPVQECIQVVPHVIQENFYENGPCYENIKCAGRNLDEKVLNHLSNSSSSNLTEACVKANCTTEKNETNHNTSASTKKRQMILQPSPAANASPSSPRSSFGSILSAFRPVGGTYTLTPHRICSPSAQSPLTLHSNNQACPSHNNDTDVQQRSRKSSQNMYGDQSTLQAVCASRTSPTRKYIEQGAIPKSVKQRNSLSNNSTILSWKNIPLPLSYNHSESASNESEKKMPSKTIPFTDSSTEISNVLKTNSFAETTESSKLSHVYPLSSSVPIIPSSSSSGSSKSEVPTSESDALSASPTVNTPEANPSFSLQSKSNSSDQPGGSQPYQATLAAAAVPSRNVLSSVKEASTQVNSGLTSRWHSHRMGGNQSLLQSRREELLNSRRGLEPTTRGGRPFSMPSRPSQLSSSNGASGFAASRLDRSRLEEAPHNSASADPTHPLSLSSYLVNQPSHGQQQSLPLHQNHLLQHYPLQPQQPRLGVQLHQRRQQQHQLQQNIESQLQHQQQPQHHLGNQQQNLNGQHARNGQGRPLFSVIL